MLMTTRKPATVGEILIEEFMEPMGLTQGALAEAMGVARKHVNELCNDRRTVTARTALILARVFGNSGRVLAERAAAHRSVASDAFAGRAQTNRTRPAAEKRGVIHPSLRGLTSGAGYRRCGWFGIMPPSPPASPLW
jgi:antitoxin HigA-1